MSSAYASQGCADETGNILPIDSFGRVSVALLLLRTLARSLSIVLHRYIKRRAQEAFRGPKSSADAAAVEQQWQRAKEELEVVKRQSVVYSLYARKHKSVMVSGWAGELQSFDVMYQLAVECNSV